MTHHKTNICHTLKSPFFILTRVLAPLHPSTAAHFPPTLTLPLPTHPHGAQAAAAAQAAADKTAREAAAQAAATEVVELKRFEKRDGLKRTVTLT